MDMVKNTRIRSCISTTITMFVALSLSRQCRQVHSWLPRPGNHHRTLGGKVMAVVTSNRCAKVLFSSSVDVDETRTTDAGPVSEEDRLFLARALEHAKLGHGRTFPNPAVGCVLVQQDTGKILGEGFHPKAGNPHAEVFALLEAAGHVESGVSSAKSVLDGTPNARLSELVEEYKTSDGGGPVGLFGDALADVPVTAYVTLEPCCHYGQTPPCAASLSLAKVDRVVVGFRDPNPKVDGGGVKVLEDTGIVVDMADDAGCASIVENFVQRILPKDYDSQNYSHINGAMRRGLRKLANQKKQEQSLEQVVWTSRGDKATDEVAVQSLELSPEWMEHLDDLLWKKELVNLRLNKAVGKKKLAKLLGNRVASSLGAHVAQIIGHTVLLYRPAMPEPVLDLEGLASSDDDDYRPAMPEPVLDLEGLASSDDDDGDKN